jgi:hypothetical protein
MPYEAPAFDSTGDFSMPYEAPAFDNFDSAGVDFWGWDNFGGGYDGGYGGGGGGGFRVDMPRLD